MGKDDKMILNLLFIFLGKKLRTRFNSYLATYKISSDLNLLYYYFEDCAILRGQDCQFLCSRKCTEGLSR